MKALIRYAAYPLIFGGCALGIYWLLASEANYWPGMPLIAVFGIGCVALLERIQPFHAEWLNDHDDTLADVLHAFTSLSLIFLSMEMVNVARWFIPIWDIWPHQTPLLLQLLIAGAIVDFGLFFMHWLSHKQAFLWKLHALHHSSKRLYWLNGERRHPISALVLALPGVAITVVIGTPAELVGTWFAIVAVHLAFQHANLDYRLGPLKHVLGVAEVHRWHHKREYEDAQVNFGEFWVLWDKLFGTFLSAPQTLKANEVGMRETLPTQYLKQITWPFLSKP